MKKLIKNKKFVTSLLGLGAIAVLVIGLTAGSGSASSGSTAVPPSSASVPVKDSPPIYIGEVGAGVSHFRVLKPATVKAVEALPETVARALANLRNDPSVAPANSSAAADPIRGTVTALGTTSFGAGQSEAGIAEVNGVICLFATGKDYEGAAVGSCPSLEQAESGAGYTVIPGLSPGKDRVIGVVPDGVTSVQVDSNEDGSVDQQVQVTSNLYQVDLNPVATAITGLTEEGKPAFTLNLALGS
jgi:hypothetical protein